MNQYSPVKTGQKAATIGTTVSIAGIVAVIAVNKLHPYLIANGVDIDQSVLIVGITAALQSGYTSIANWLKHRGKK